MFSITVKGSQAIRRMKTRHANIKKLSDFFRKKQTIYHKQAVELTYQTVYQDFPESVYKRTGNLLSSVNSKLFKDNQSSGLQIFIDPSKANIKAESPKTFKYYPSYVLRGIFEWRGVKHPGPRRFLDIWYQVIGERFEKDFKKEFHDAIKV